MSVLKHLFNCRFMENENFHGVHPGAASVAKYCVSTLESHAGGTNVNSLLHTMTLLKDVISVFPKSQIKPACEMVLKIMASGEPRALSCGFQVLYGLFAGRSVGICISYYELQTLPFQAYFELNPFAQNAQKD